MPIATFTITYSTDSHGNQVVRQEYAVRNNVIYATAAVIIAAPVLAPEVMPLSAPLVRNFAPRIAAVMAAQPAFAGEATSNYSISTEFEGPVIFEKSGSSLGPSFKPSLRISGNNPDGQDWNVSTEGFSVTSKLGDIGEGRRHGTHHEASADGYRMGYYNEDNDTRKYYYVGRVSGGWTVFGSEVTIKSREDLLTARQSSGVHVSAFEGALGGATNNVTGGEPVAHAFNDNDRTTSAHGRAVERETDRPTVRESAPRPTHSLVADEAAQNNGAEHTTTMSSSGGHRALRDSGIDHSSNDDSRGDNENEIATADDTSSSNIVIPAIEDPGGENNEGVVQPHRDDLLPGGSHGERGGYDILHSLDEAAEARAVQLREDRIREVVTSGVPALLAAVNDGDYAHMGNFALQAAVNEGLRQSDLPLRVGVDRQAHHMEREYTTHSGEVQHQEVVDAIEDTISIKLKDDAGNSFEVSVPWNYHKTTNDFYYRTDGLPFEVRKLMEGAKIHYHDNALTVVLPGLQEQQIELVTAKQKVEDKSSKYFGWSKKTVVTTYDFGYNQHSTVTGDTWKRLSLTKNGLESTSVVESDVDTTSFRDKRSENSEWKNTPTGRKHRQNDVYGPGEQRETLGSTKEHRKTTYTHCLTGSYESSNTSAESRTSTDDGRVLHSREASSDDTVAKFTTESDITKQSGECEHTVKSGSIHNIRSESLKQTIDNKDDWAGNCDTNADTSQTNTYEIDYDDGTWERHNTKRTGTMTSHRENRQTTREWKVVEESSVTKGTSGKNDESCLQSETKDRTGTSVTRKGLFTQTTKTTETVKSRTGPNKEAVVETKNEWAPTKAGAKALSSGVGGVFSLVTRYASGTVVTWNDVAEMASASVQGLAEGQLMQVLDDRVQSIGDRSETAIMGGFGLAFVALSYYRNCKKSWVRGRVLECDDSHCKVKLLSCDTENDKGDVTLQIDESKFRTHMRRDNTYFKGRRVEVKGCVPDDPDEFMKAVVVKEEAAWDITRRYFKLQLFGKGHIGKIVKMVPHADIRLLEETDDAKPVAPKDYVFVWPDTKTVDVNANLVLDVIASSAQAFIVAMDYTGLKSSAGFVVVQFLTSMMRMGILVGRGEMSSNQFKANAWVVLKSMTVNMAGGVGALSIANTVLLTVTNPFSALVGNVLVYSIGASLTTAALSNLEASFSYVVRWVKYKALAGKYGLTTEASDEDVARRLRFRSRKVHPDSARDKSLMTSLQRGTVVARTSWWWSRPHVYTISIDSGKDILFEIPHDRIEDPICIDEHKPNDSVRVKFYHSNEAMQDVYADFKQLADFRVYFSKSDHYKDGLYTLFSYFYSLIQEGLKKKQVNLDTALADSTVDRAVNHMNDNDGDIPGDCVIAAGINANVVTDETLHNMQQGAAFTAVR